MRPKLYLLMAWLPFLAVSCTDTCRETRTYRRFTSVTLSTAQIRQGVETAPTRTLVNPGKLYTKDGFLFINELKEGIHVVDNRDPAAPKMVSFLHIPGNGDIAIRNNILYADSYMDLLTFDISDPQHIRQLKRMENVFPNGQFDGGWWSLDTARQIVNDQKVDYVTETVKTNCDAPTTAISPTWDVWTITSGTFYASSANQSSAASSSAGIGGSMARFALYDHYLYTVNRTTMQLFDIQKPADPQLGNSINLGWNIETIYPYKDKLFIGSQTGMQIFDNSNPEKPVAMSTFQHAGVCDPVVVHEDKAYITLRSGTTCQGFTNQLDVVDISNLYNPRLLKSYPMKNPHGLTVDFPNLFICEGAYGLKTLDAKDALNIQELDHLEGFHAYDVIALGKTLLVIGQDGFYQYDYSNPRKLRRLSTIPVKRPYPVS